MYTKTTGTKAPAAKKAAGKGPGATKGIEKKGKVKAAAAKKKEKKELPKKTVEELDAELMSYTAERSGAAATEEAAAPADA